MSEGWLGEARSLANDLATAPGRLALLAGGSTAETVAHQLAAAWDTIPIEVGRLLTADEVPPSPDRVVGQLSAGMVYVDLEVLFSPELPIDVGRRKLARPFSAVLLHGRRVGRSQGALARRRHGHHDRGSGRRSTNGVDTEGETAGGGCYGKALRSPEVADALEIIRRLLTLA